MPRKTDRFIVTPQPVEQLVYHDLAKRKQEGRTVQKMMDSSLVPEADMTVMGGNRIELKEHPLKAIIEPHKHEVSELYVILEDLVLEVILDGERHEVTGPACVFIPAGMTHTFRILVGSGCVLAILRAGKYE